MSVPENYIECSYCQEWYDPELKRCSLCRTPKKKNRNAASLGSLGGKASAKAMTPEQRTERARKAGKARQ